jgi:hypothetical protein
MSAAQKRAKADPEVRARMSAAQKRAKADPEVRARMSAASKRAWARRAVMAANLPLLRKFVDLAHELIDGGDPIEIVSDALRAEFGAAI